MRFRQLNLPLLVALSALVVYLATLSHGVTTGSLILTAKVARWDWQPMAGGPLLWLLTLPVRLLPSGLVPYGLNLFSAICGAITLGVLARSLQLLPWPRPLTSLGRLRSVPVLLAVLVCGLEFNFWSEATAASGQMLDVLLLAVPVWCLLEFHPRNDVRWLRAAVFVWGLGMAQNWMMLLTLPLFIGVLAWLRPFDFPQPRFFLPLAGWLGAGFSVYALLPLANGLQPGSPWSFSEAWLVSLKQTKHLLGVIMNQGWRAHRPVCLGVMIYYLVPLGACLLRLHDEDTANKLTLDRFYIWLVRWLRLGLLGICVWMAFDPVVGPRGILKHNMNYPIPLLSFDYLCGLGAGYLAGNLLLIQRRKPDPENHYEMITSRWGIWLEWAMMPLVVVVSLMVGIGLPLRNVPAITAANRCPLTGFGELALRSLPPEGGVMLSDVPEKLLVFQAAQANHPEPTKWLPVDTRLLPTPDYRERLEQFRPGQWRLTATNQHDLTPLEMARLMVELTQSHRVCYLHNSYGYYFETFYPELSGSIAELKRYPTNAVNPPALTTERIAHNEALWETFVPQFEALQQAGQAGNARFWKWLNRKWHLEPAVPDQIILLKEWYSAAVNAWGVELQRNGRLPAAQKRFEQALALNPDNWIAKVNFYGNTNLQAHNSLTVANTARLASQFDRPEKFTQLLTRYGPADEPTLCYLLGNVYEQANLPRQALQNMERAAALAPEDLAPQLALASLYVRYRLEEPAGRKITQLREMLKGRTNAAGVAVGLSMLEADLCLARTNLAGARRIYQALLREHQGKFSLENRILQAYMAMGDWTNADAVASSQLQQKPNDLAALTVKSGAYLRQGRAGDAIPVLNRILALTNSLPAKLYRAAAYLQITNLTAARADYRELQNTSANPFFVNLGLAEIALRTGDTNVAIQHLTLCLSNTPPDSMQHQVIRDRLEELNQATNQSK